jgi:tetratricopeptide (TPR) repeat protein
MVSVKKYKAVLYEERRKALQEYRFLKAAKLFALSLKAPKKELEPDNYFILGELFMEKEEIESARQVIEEGLNADPGNPKLNLELAYFHTEAKEWKKAEAIMRNIFSHSAPLMAGPEYAMYAQSLRHLGNFAEAEQILETARDQYPLDEDVLLESGELYVSIKQWKKALSYLEKANINSNTSQTLRMEVLMGKSYRMAGDLDQAETIIEHAMARNDRDLTVLFERAETHLERSQWREALDGYTAIIAAGETVNPIVYSRKRLAEVKLEDYVAAKATLAQGLALYPKNKGLNNANVKVSIALKDWDSAIKQLVFLKNTYNGETKQRALLDLAMLHKNVGNSDEAENILTEFYAENERQPLKSFKDGYRIITLFDNGDCRIDYHKKLTRATALCITFDTINNTWNDIPFGYKFLKKQDVDIVTVTKRKNPDRYQDLSIEDFHNTVHKLAGTYNRTITYGSSIGGYSALYYGSSINAHVIAMAPRNSGHPIYGKNQVEGEFKHLLNPPVNNEISPYIIYDPNNILDNKYVEESLSKIYPKARFIKCYHAGHNCVSHFHDIGILKDFIVNVINGEEVPQYRHSEMKGASRQYLRVLATACLNDNKPKWALDIINKAFAKFPEDIAVNVFRIRAIKAAEGLESAITASKETIGRIKNHQKIKLNLIDLYIQAGNIQSAEALVEDGLRTYKNPKEFMRKRKKYGKLFEKQLA